jgi:ATP-dependent Clp protease ATP-binding subunit ClpB
MPASNREQVIADARNETLELLRKTVRPEFLNRIDEIIMFTPLDENEIRRIVVMQLQGLSRMLEKNGLTLTFSDDAIALIARKGYDPQFGARPVKRVIQDLVLNELSRRILGATIDRSRPVRINAGERGLTFSN